MGPGTVIEGKYELVRRIGEGGMGAVYEARHIRIKRRVALKLMHPELGRRPDIVERFLREARATASIGSEHIVDVIDAGETSDGDRFLVLEYLDGENLAQVLAREGPFEPVRAVRLVLQASKGVGAAHTQGIIHRDLKPENLFLTRREDGVEWIKVLDFGVAKFRDSVSQQMPKLTVTGSALGSPYYMSPEQARGVAEVDRRVDVYALGVILYELLTGERPYRAVNFNQLILLLATTTPPPPRSKRPDLSPALEQVVLRAMAKKPEARYASMSELARDLSSFLASLGLATTPGGLPAPSRSPAHAAGPTRAAPGTASKPAVPELGLAATAVAPELMSTGLAEDPGLAATGIAPEHVAPELLRGSQGTGGASPSVRPEEHRFDGASRRTDGLAGARPSRRQASPGSSGRTGGDEFDGELRPPPTAIAPYHDSGALDILRSGRLPESAGVSRSVEPQGRAGNRWALVTGVGCLALVLIGLVIAGVAIVARSSGTRRGPRPAAPARLDGPGPSPAAATGPTAGQPFAVGQEWTGSYLCPQGPTGASLRITVVSGASVTGVFTFNSLLTATSGSFYMSGSYEPGTRRLLMQPGQWIQQPPGWITAGLDGYVSPAGEQYSGVVTDPDCSTFTLRR